MSRAVKSDIIGAFLATLFAIAQFRVIVFILQSYGLEGSADVAAGVFAGEPHWKVFQSRILAPAVVKALSLAFPSFLSAHAFFNVAGLAVAGYLAWRLGRRHGGGNRGALLALAVFEMSFAFLLSPPWLYSWDFLDIIIFLIFMDLVLSQAAFGWFVALFAIAIFNRDSAQFIAIWLVVDSIVPQLLSRLGWAPSVAFDWRKLLAGIICFAAGLAVVEILKQTLLVSEVGPRIFPSSPIPADMRYVFALFFNLDLIGKVFRTFDYQLWFFVPAFLVLVVILAIAVAWRDPVRYLSLALVALAMVASLMMFAWFVETRVYLVLVPFLVAAAIILTNPDRRAGA